MCEIILVKSERQVKGMLMTIMATDEQRLDSGGNMHPILLSRD